MSMSRSRFLTSKLETYGQQRCQNMQDLPMRLRVSGMHRESAIKLYCKPKFIRFFLERVDRTVLCHSIEATGLRICQAYSICKANHGLSTFLSLIKAQGKLDMVQTRCAQVYLWLTSSSIWCMLPHWLLSLLDQCKAGLRSPEASTQSLT